MSIEQSLVAAAAAAAAALSILPSWRRGDHQYVRSSVRPSAEIRSILAHGNNADVAELSSYGISRVVLELDRHYRPEHTCLRGTHPPN